jgi:myo-inositol-1(or 4)-monophosphatase
MSRSPQEYAVIALEVARQAGAEARRGFRKHPSSVEKRPAELVTEFDLASERLIRERLAERTPEIPIVGEEAGGEASEGLTWYCDPIDGTTNFVHGHPFWSVSIGLMNGAQPIAGAVVAPSLGIEWWGGAGAGAFRADGQDPPSALRVSGTRALRDALVATGFPSDRSRSPANNFQAFERAKVAVRGVRRCGSAAIDVCLVADGTYDAYWERALSAWDLAGGTAIALEAGACVTALDGGPPDIKRGHVLVSNGRLHDELLALVG